MSFIDALYRHLGICQAPIMTNAHKYVGVASLLGFLYVIAHLITVIVTCVKNGFGWGINAWIFDMMGVVAGGLFAILCRKVSNKPSFECKKEIFWIAVWSGITLCVRVLDVLMLFGIVVINDIYETPHGAVLTANIVSEIIVAIPYNLLAFIGSMKLLMSPEDDKEMTRQLV